MQMILPKHISVLLEEYLNGNQYVSPILTYGIL